MTIETAKRQPSQDFLDDLAARRAAQPFRARIAKWQMQATRLGALMDRAARTGQSFPHLAEEITQLRTDVEAALREFGTDYADLPPNVASSSYVADIERALTMLRDRLRPLAAQPLRS